MTKDINIHDIARKAGVSVATVSRALNDNGPVSVKTRQRIQQIAKEYDYKPNPIAKGFARQRSETIGVILPELVDEFFTEVLRGIDEEATRANRYTLVSSSHDRRNIVEILLEFMSSGRVDGVILMAPFLHGDIHGLLKKSKRPLVLLNSGDDLSHFPSFNFNNYQGAFAVTEHLIKHGYKKIATLSGPDGNHDAEERFRGFKDALQQADLPVQENFVVQGGFTLRSGYHGFMRLISQPDKPDAIFAANDMMAVGAYEAVKSLRLNIPVDIAVAGFDDIFLSRLLTPTLTTVHVPIHELATKAVKHLVQMIDGKIDTNDVFHEEVSTGLVIGGSCGCTNYNNQSFI
ncbi:MAG: LacI family transcriptional regulator [Calditrichaeota bacterium]|nr:MAG: LacI family transcriptional regulator [Calditrichota bacterium]